MSSTSKTFNTTITGLYSNMGSYSLVNEINPDEYHNLRNNMDNLSMKIKHSELRKENLEKLYDELNEIEIMNDYVKYIIDENNTKDNILFGLDLIKTLVDLYEILLLIYTEDNVKQAQYELLHEIHEDLNEKEIYFHHHILLDDKEHEKQLKNTEYEEIVTYDTKNDFFKELEQW